MKTSLAMTGLCAALLLCSGCVWMSNGFSGDRIVPVTSKPKSAMVSYKGEEVGETPYQLVVPAGDTGEVVVTKEGFEEAKIEITQTGPEWYEWIYKWPDVFFGTHTSPSPDAIKVELQGGEEDGDKSTGDDQPEVSHDAGDEESKPAKKSRNRWRRAASGKGDQSHDKNSAGGPGKKKDSSTASPAKSSTNPKGRRRETSKPRAAAPREKPAAKTPEPFTTETYDLGEFGALSVDAGVDDAEILVNGKVWSTNGSLDRVGPAVRGLKVEIRAPGREPWSATVDIESGKRTAIAPALASENR